MLQLIWRWMQLNKWKLGFTLLLISASVLLIWQPNFITGAIDALRIPYTVGLTLFIVIFFIRGNKMLSTGGAIALLILAPGIWKYFKPEQAPTQQLNKVLFKDEVKSDFSILHYNVKENNKKIDQLAESALSSNADFVSFQELQLRTLDAIDTVMHKKYPYQLSDLSSKGFGLAIYSKHPIIETKVIKEKDFPVLTGKVNVNGQSFHFISATTSTPTNEKDYATQEKQFKLIAQYANQIDSPLIVMGDMNAVPWSEQIESLLKITKLKDSRKDLSGTYPSQSLFVKIPIDYIFFSTNLSCVDFRTLSQSTSNHLGIIGFYKFKEEYKQKSKEKSVEESTKNVKKKN